MTAGRGLDRGGVERLRERLGAHVERGDVPGLIALLARGDDVAVLVLGTPALDDPAPLRRDAIFRIASLTKPIAAAGAMALVDDGVLAVDDPIERVRARAGRPARAAQPRRAARRHRSRPSARSPWRTCSPSASASGRSWSRRGTYPIQIAEEELGLATLGPPWPPPYADLRRVDRPLRDAAADAPARSRLAATTPARRCSASSSNARPANRCEAFLRLPSVRAARHGGHRLQRAAGVAVALHDRVRARRGRRAAPARSARRRLVERAAGDGQRVGGCSCPRLTTCGRSWHAAAGGARDDGQRVLSSSSVAAMTRDHLTAEQRDSAGCSSASAAAGATAWARPARSRASRRCRGASAGTAAPARPGAAIRCAG